MSHDLPFAFSIRTVSKTCLCLVVLLLVAGCDQSQSIDTVQPRRVSTRPEGREPNTSSTSAQNADENVRILETPDFSDDANFFSVPTAAPAQVEIARNSNNEQVTIRLLGFINAAPGNLQQRSALFKFGKRLVHLREGEAFDGTKLLTIEDRTVTLQRKRDRWTLAMMDQPIVNRAIAPRSVLRNRAPKHRPMSTLLPEGPEIHGQELPIARPWTPDAPSLPTAGDQLDAPKMDRPEDLPMPELPDVGLLDD